MNYYVDYVLLNSKDFGIPQNRERVWIFANLIKEVKLNEINNLKVPLILKIKDFLDHKDEIPANLYLNNNQIDRLEELHKVNLNIDDTYMFDVYNKKIKTDGICQTLTESHHNTIRVIEPNRKVRKLSVKEHFRLMGIEKIIIPSGMSYSALCDKAANGWDVNVVSIIFTYLNNNNFF